MTTSTPSSNRRRRTPWIIGGIVLVGVGLVVGGNWDSIRIRYYVYRIESGAANTTKVNFLKVGVHYDIPKELDSLSTTSSIHESIKALVSMGDGAHPTLEKLLDSPDRKVRIWTAHFLPYTGSGCPEHLKPKLEAIRGKAENQY